MSRVAEEYVAGLAKKKTGPDGKPLSNAELRVLKVLAYQHNEFVWCAWPRLRGLAEEVGMSQSHLRRTLAGLEQRELVKRYGAVSERWGEATSNEYELVGLGPAAVPQSVRDSVFKYNRTRLATQLSLRRGGRKKKGQVQSDHVEEVATAGDARQVQSDQVEEVATAGDAREEQVQSDQVEDVATAGDARQVQSDQVEEVATAGDAREEQVQSDQVEDVATAGDAREEQVQSDQVEDVATAGDAREEQVQSDQVEDVATAGDAREEQVQSDQVEDVATAGDAREEQVQSDQVEDVATAGDAREEQVQSDQVEEVATAGDAREEQVQSDQVEDVATAGDAREEQVQSDQVEEVATAGDAREEQVQSDQVEDVATAGDAREEQVQSDQVEDVATAGDARVVEMSVEMSVEMIGGGNHHDWGGQPPRLPVEFLKELQVEVLTPLTPLCDAQRGKTSNGKSKSAWTGQKPEAKATAKAKAPGKVLEFLQRGRRDLDGEEAALYDATEDVLHACGVATKTCPRRLWRAIEAALECAVAGGDCDSLDDAVKRAYSSWLEYRGAAACLIGPLGMRQFFLGGDWLDRKGWRWNMRAVEASGRVLPWMRRRY